MHAATNGPVPTENAANAAAAAVNSASGTAPVVNNRRGQQQQQQPYNAQQLPMENGIDFRQHPGSQVVGPPHSAQMR